MIVFLMRVRMRLIAFVSILALSIFGLISSVSAGGLASAPKTVDHRATIADKAPVAKVGYRYRRSYRRGHRRFRLRFGRHYGYRHRHYSHRQYRYRPYRYRHYGYYSPHYKRRHYRLKRFYRNRHLRRHFRRHLRRW